VEGHPVDDGKPVKTLEEDLADLDHRYRSVMDNKLMAALKMVVQKHIKKKHEELADEKARMEALNASEEEPSEA